MQNVIDEVSSFLELEPCVSGDDQTTYVYNWYDYDLWYNFSLIPIKKQLILGVFSLSASCDSPTGQSLISIALIYTGISKTTIRSLGIDENCLRFVTNEPAPVAFVLVKISPGLFRIKITDREFGKVIC